MSQVLVYSHQRCSIHSLTCRIADGDGYSEACVSPPSLSAVNGTDNQVEVIQMLQRGARSPLQMTEKNLQS